MDWDEGQRRNIIQNIFINIGERNQLSACNKDLKQMPIENYYFFNSTPHSFMYCKVFEIRMYSFNNQCVDLSVSTPTPLPQSSYYINDVFGMQSKLLLYLKISDGLKIRKLRVLWP